eukprot:1610121-Prymnesium_polylepis.2
MAPLLVLSQRFPLGAARHPEFRPGRVHLSLPLTALLRYKPRYALQRYNTGDGWTALRVTA